MAEVWIIDGYNILRGLESFRQHALRNPARQIEPFCMMLETFAMASGCQLTVVFDGTGEIMAPFRDVRLVFAGHRQTADTVIERMVYQAKDRKPLIVATSDRALRDMVVGMGARVRSIREFEQELSEVIQ